MPEAPKGGLGCKLGACGCSAATIFLVGFFILFAIAFFATHQGEPSLFTGGGGSGDCWSLTNGQAVSAETLQNFLKDKNPEFESDIGSAVSGWAVKFNINPALMVGISRADSSYGTAGAGHTNKNPGNTTISNAKLDELGVPHRPDRDVGARDFARFDRYGDGYGGLAATLLVAADLYKLNSNSLEEILRIWANGPSGGPLAPSYLATVKGDMTELLKNCVSTGVARGDIVSVARAEIGKEERRGENRVKYNNWDGQAWCASFVTWVYREAGHSLNKDGGNGIIPGTSTLKDYFKKYEILIEGSNNPQPGDIFWVQTSFGMHVGIFVKTQGNKFVSIEGNTSNDAVEEITSRDLSDILWLGRLK